MLPVRNAYIYLFISCFSPIERLAPLEVFTIVSVLNVLLFCVHPKMPKASPKKISFCGNICIYIFSVIISQSLIETGALIWQEWALSHEVHGNSLADRVFSTKTFRSFQLKKGQMCLAKLRFLQQAKMHKASGVIQHNYTLFSSLHKNVFDEWGHWWNHKKTCWRKNSGFSKTPQRRVSSSSSHFNTGFASLACWRFLHEPTSDLLHHLKQIN